MENVNHTARTRGRYVGPSAARIAELIAPRQRVRFERGWFWTAAVCHESEQDLLAFRQRPDGDGIDVRCKSAGCSRERVIRSLEQLTGESIWSAYTTEPRTSTLSQAPSKRTDATGGRSRGLALTPFIVLFAVAPLVFGYDLQVMALNSVGLGWAGWLARRVLLSRRRSLARGGRPR
ncbi:MAG: hypothetical protein OXI41_13955 [Chloroflexota bacterium]|nr:hypothetical protein [Chloroflexota bacterium]